MTFMKSIKITKYFKLTAITASVLVLAGCASVNFDEDRKSVV